MTVFLLYYDDRYEGTVDLVGVFSSAKLANEAKLKIKCFNQEWLYITKESIDPEFI